jgi:hypothetical protein
LIFLSFRMKKSRAIIVFFSLGLAGKQFVKKNKVRKSCSNYAPRSLFERRAHGRKSASIHRRS